MLLTCGRGHNALIGVENSSVMILKPIIFIFWMGPQSCRTLFCRDLPEAQRRWLRDVGVPWNGQGNVNSHISDISWSMFVICAHLTILGILHHHGSITGLKTDRGSDLGKGAKAPTNRTATNMANNKCLAITIRTKTKMERLFKVYLICTNDYFYFQPVLRELSRQSFKRGHKQTHSLQLTYMLLCRN